LVAFVVTRRFLSIGRSGVNWYDGGAGRCIRFLTRMNRPSRKAQLRKIVFHPHSFLKVVASLHIGKTQLPAPLGSPFAAHYLLLPLGAGLLTPPKRLTEGLPP